jgi:hypothetical protein
MLPVGLPAQFNCASAPPPPRSPSSIRLDNAKVRIAPTPRQSRDLLSPPVATSPHLTYRHPLSRRPSRVLCCPHAQPHPRPAQPASRPHTATPYSRQRLCSPSRAGILRQAWPTLDRNEPAHCMRVRTPPPHSPSPQFVAAFCGTVVFVRPPRRLRRRLDLVHSWSGIEKPVAFCGMVASYAALVQRRHLQSNCRALLPNHPTRLANSKCALAFCGKLAPPAGMHALARAPTSQRCGSPSSLQAGERMEWVGPA